MKREEDSSDLYPPTTVAEESNTYSLGSETLTGRKYSVSEVPGPTNDMEVKK